MTFNCAATVHDFVFGVQLTKDDPMDHGLRTPNEGINQRNLKIWADVADKIYFGRTVAIR